MPFTRLLARAVILLGLATLTGCTLLGYGIALLLPHGDVYNEYALYGPDVEFARTYAKENESSTLYNRLRIENVSRSTTYTLHIGGRTLSTADCTMEDAAEMLVGIGETIVYPTGIGIPGVYPDGPCVVFSSGQIGVTLRYTGRDVSEVYISSGGMWLTGNLRSIEITFPSGQKVPFPVSKPQLEAILGPPTKLRRHASQ